jgi:FKBP-type peptidyl-prolyl cis-trans isomerase
MAIEEKTRREKIGNILRRTAWASLALLFLVTGLGVGVWAFWINTHPDKSTQQQAPTSTLQGTQLSGFTPVAKVETLQVVDTKAGIGAAVVASSTVTVAYTGAVAATGTIFQSSSDINGGQPVQFELSKVIKGWQEGMVGMKAGGQRRILIPATEAYGATPPSGSGIPANAALVFDITLMAVK